jgi:hypothetical protein
MASFDRDAFDVVDFDVDAFNLGTVVDATTASLTLNTLAASIDLNIKPNVAALTLDTYQPQVSLDIKGDKASLTLNTLAATRKFDPTVTGTVGALTLNTLPVTVNAATSISATVAGLTLNAFAATIDEDTVAFDGNAFDRDNAFDVDAFWSCPATDIHVPATAATLTLNTYRATPILIRCSFDFEAFEAESFDQEAFDICFPADVVEATTASLTLEQKRSHIAGAHVRVPPTASLTLNTHEATIVATGQTIQSDVAALTLNTYQPSVTYPLGAGETASLTLNVYQSFLSPTTQVNPNVADLSLETYEASVQADTDVIQAAVAALSLEIERPSLVLPSGDVWIGAAPADLTLNTHEASINFNTQAGVAALSLATYAVTVIQGVSAQTASLTLTTYRPRVERDYFIRPIWAQMLLNQHNPELDVPGPPPPPTVINEKSASARPGYLTAAELRKQRRLAIVQDDEDIAVLMELAVREIVKKTRR